tara:strand:+ start:168 stop:359 length:192 start_codon:yes stop_codon:yes gene_type:complete
MITLKLYIPEANAEVAGMDYFDLANDWDFKNAVKSVTKQTINDECYVKIEYSYQSRITHLWCD